MSESNTFVRTHNPSPVGQLKTDRGFWKLFFLSLIPVVPVLAGNKNQQEEK